MILFITGRTTRALWLLVAAALLPAATVSPAQAGPSDRQLQTEVIRLSDEMAIRRLLDDYVWLLYRQDFDGYGRLFSQGAVLNRDGGVVAQGAEQVAAIARYHLGGRPDLFVRHINSSPVIEVDSANGTATARSFLTTLQAPQGQPAFIFCVARYEDRFAKSDGRWHFVSRQEVTDWVLKEHEPPVSLLPDRQP